MNILLAMGAAFTQSIQSILKRNFNDRAHGGVFLFCAISSAFACLFFVITASDFSYRAEQLLMSVLFAVAYCVSVIFSALAIKTGSLAKTNLIISYSLLIPTFYGIIFKNESAKATLLVGIVLLAAALFMTNYNKKSDENTGSEDKRASFKWLVFVMISFIGNGMCTIVQDVETSMYGDSGKSMFMIIALAIVSAFLTTYTLCLSTERKELKFNLKCGIVFGSLCGIANGLTNFLVLYLLSRLPSSVMFPIISAGGMVFVFLYSIIFLKEKYTAMQKIGYALGVLSIIFLNL